MEWNEQLAKAKANGREYADNGIAAGQRTPDESPLSGEWAGALTPKDVVEMAAGPGTFDNAQDYEVTELCDAWEDGYLSAEWPEPAGDEDDDGPARDSDLISPVIDDAGQVVIPAPNDDPLRFHPGDEVEILMGGEWVGPYTVTDGEGRSPEHLVLRGRSGVFEHHNDAPHNTRRVL